MATSTIWVGQDTTFRMTAVDESEAPANPSGVRFKVKAPSGTVTTYTLGSSSAVEEITAGKVYDLTFDASTAGRWNVRGELLDSGGNVVAVVEDAMVVLASGVI